MTGTLLVFPPPEAATQRFAHYFGASHRPAAAANRNAPRRAVLFDVAACFGAMPVSCGPLDLVRAQRDVIAATGDGWYADMPREVRAMLKLNRAALRIVEIPAEEGDWPELDAILADLFERSGLPPEAAIARLERLVACLARIGAHCGPVPGSPA